MEICDPPVSSGRCPVPGCEPTGNIRSGMGVLLLPRKQRNVREITPWFINDQSYKDYSLEMLNKFGFIKTQWLTTFDVFDIFNAMVQ